MNRDRASPERAGGKSRFSAKMGGSLSRRRVVNHAMGFLTVLAAAAAVLPLLFILSYLILKGGQSVNLDFFTRVQVPVGVSGGGMAHSIVGTLVLIAVASCVGLPVGIGAGLFLAERKAGVLPTMVRFLSDVLNGLPTIVMGIFVWQVLVRPTRQYSALAGGLALAAIMIPLVTRTTEEMIRTVPSSLREAALSLGYTQWRTSLTVVLRTVTAGILTGVLVAVARIAGETAPLMFTIFGRNTFSTALNENISALPLQVYRFANSSFEEWQRMAWAGALVLVLLVLVISAIAKFATRSPFPRGGD
jgi:phosphate transport system permease protein